MVIEELKQRVTAKAAKIRRYESRIDQFKQNRLFQNNLMRLFEKLEGQEIESDATPDTTESIAFGREFGVKKFIIMKMQSG